MPTNYFEIRDYKIVPIREIDKFKIMEWRNEQLFHLRQKNKLTKIEQENYFRNVVDKSFLDETPNQILFSFLKGFECIGYGGLVHINWNHKIAEISFLIKTDLNKKKFEEFWNIFLKLMEKVSFKVLDFNEIYTVSFNKRPLLYRVLKQNNFKNVLKKKSYLKYSDEISMLVNVKDSYKLELRRVFYRDCDLLFKWANDKKVRQYSLNENKISWDEHMNWFNSKINDNNVNIYVLEKLKIPAGQIRIENIHNVLEISFSISKEYRGQGLGSYLIRKVLENNPKENFKARVKLYNKKSKNIFDKFNFRVSKKENNVITYIYP